ncbi:O-antigen ligase family protein [Candidatus Caldatribacterium sp.]|uniref:O-antigen ligase family protein n=1 Tax=Candidatus Caldatribacterium sp. TaxID=2282143 RepID=UPI002999B8DD|nr:O-antigen ligase family protein [Candidatus Caldatribacterium sp.]MDW8082148.1 O-antigen ligase family protein [Candidatus Calescibacterium sp.]
MSQRSSKAQRKSLSNPLRFESAVFWLLFVPVLLAPYYRGLYFTFERLPFFLFLCGVGATLAILRAYHRVYFTFPLRFMIPFALLALLYGINIPFSADHGLAYREFINWATYCLFLLLIIALKPKPSKTVLLLFGLNAAILVSLGLFQAFGWLPEGVYFPGMSFRALFLGGRLYSTFQYPNTASAYFGMGYLSLLGLLLWEGENENLQNLASFLAFLVFGGVFFTYSRGGLFALGLVLLLLFFFLPHRLRVSLFSGALATLLPFVALLPLLERFLHIRQPLPFWGIFLSGSLITLALQGILTPLKRRLLSWPAQKFLIWIVILFAAAVSIFLLTVQLGLVGGGATRLLDVSLRTRNVWERLMFYRDGLKIFARRPLNGWGGGGWEALYASFRSYPYTTKTTHNLYLQVLIEGGLLGIILFASFLFFLFQGLGRALATHPISWTGILYGILLLAFLHGFVDFNFSLGAYQLAVWFFAGCAICAPTERKAPDRKLSSLTKLHPLLVGIASLLLLTFLALSTGAEWNYAFGEYFAKEGEVDRAIQFFEQAIRFEPWNPALHYSLSEALREKVEATLSKATHIRATEVGEHALRLSPYNSLILEHVGILYAERKEFSEALHFLKRAIATDPFRLNPYTNLARVCYSASMYFLGEGDKDAALLFLNEGVHIETLLQEAQERSIEPLQWNLEEIEKVLGEIKRVREQLLKNTKAPGSL